MNNQSLAHRLRRQLPSASGPEGKSRSDAAADVVGDAMFPDVVQPAKSQLERRFHALIADYCRVSGATDLAGLQNGQAVYINGSEMRLLFEPEGVAESCTILCELCDSDTLPSEKQKAVYRDMLAMNGMARDGNGPLLGLAPDTGAVLYMLRFAIGSGVGRGALLEQTLQMLAASAAIWRETYLARLEEYDQS